MEGTSFGKTGAAAAFGGSAERVFRVCPDMKVPARRKKTRQREYRIFDIS